MSMWRYLLPILFMGCTLDFGPLQPPDTSTDTDTDSDTDIDTDTDTDSDTDFPDCVRFVDKDAASGGDGLTWKTAFTTVQEAIIDASSAAQQDDICEVWVAAGTYYVYENDNDDTLELYYNVEIYGGFLSGSTSHLERDPINNKTVINGCDSDQCKQRVYHVVTGATIEGEDRSVLDGFTVTKGLASGPLPDNCGGGMYIKSSSPTVANCSFIENESTDAGGGMCILDSSEPSVTTTLFMQNGAQNGGAISISGNSTPTITSSRFIENSALMNAGAIYTNDCYTEISIRDSTFFGNSAESRGGALYTTNSADIDLLSNIFASNSANQDGAIWTVNSDLQLVNSVFFDNQGAIVGAMTLDGNSSAEITNCTYTGNGDKNSSTGAIYVMSNSMLQLRNSILWNDAGDELGKDGSGYIGVHYCNVLLGDTQIDQDEGNIGTKKEVDPQFLGNVLTGVNWSSVYNENSYQTEITADQNIDGLVSDRGLFIRPGSTGPWFPVVERDDNTIKVWGEISSVTLVDFIELHIEPDSQCESAGTIDGAPGDDIEGTTREAPPDMGAYETLTN